MATERQTPNLADESCESVPHRALVILNPAAGQGAAEVIRQLLDEALSTAEWQYEIHQTSRDEDFRSVVVRAVEDGCEIVVAVGGDGTVALTASHLVGSDVPLGIIPAGTGNILSRELGIPLDVSDALATVVGQNRLVEVDALRIGDRHFFLNAGIGLPAAVMRDTSREAKRRFGMLAYARTAVEKLLKNRTTRFRVIVDGEGRSIRAAFVMIVNAGATGIPEVRWAKDSSVDDGIVEVIAARSRNLRDFLTILWRIWTGNPVRGPIREYRAAQRITVVARRDVAVQADGEVIGERRLDAYVVPKAVRVIVPLEPSETDEPATVGEVRRATRLQRMLSKYLGPVGVVDTSAYLAISRLPHPTVLNLTMRGLSFVMTKGIGWAAGLALASRIDGARGQRALREVVPTMWLGGLMVEFPIKRLFSRARPFVAVTLSAVTGSKPSGYSFPSAHTAVSFAVAWLLRPHYPGLSPAVYGLASLVGFSRLYLGVHYLSDVIMGAVTGTVVAEGLRRLLDGRLWMRRSGR